MSADILTIAGVGVAVLIGTVMMIVAYLVMGTEE